MKGLIPIVEELLPNVSTNSMSVFCVCHLHNNLKRLYPRDAIKEMLWKCAKATSRNQFEDELKALRKYDEGVYAWLQSSASPEPGADPTSKKTSNVTSC